MAATIWWHAREWTSTLWAVTALSPPGLCLSLGNDGRDDLTTRAGISGEFTGGPAEQMADLRCQAGVRWSFYRTQPRSSAAAGTDLE